ncbi:MAG: hypothetical protein AAB495_03870 [Patescibacteria group bacterium]
MTKKTLLSLCLLFAAFSFFSSEHHAHAATMYLIPDARSVSVNQEFNVDIKIDTSDASTSINSAQATVQFPANVVSALGVDTQNSTFGFWLEGPAISNNDGTIHFIGGAIKGVEGGSLQVLRMKFKAKGVGSANFKIVDAAVATADGKGTNVLSGTQEASVAIGAINLPPSTPPPTTSVEQPIQVARVAALAKGLPIKPVLRVPAYADESRWYNRVGEAVVFWDVPEDVTQVAARVGHSKDKAIGTPEKTLSNGKDFGVLEEGIWYIKVQFKNSVGWGEPAYYKISIDTTVPLPFDIKINGVVSDNPSPTIQFETSDVLSGVAGYHVIVDGKELVVTTSTTQRLPVQSLGKHALTVRANDLAGNSVQDNIGFEVLPLPTPQINFITKSVSQGDFIFAVGENPLGSSVTVFIVDKDNREIFRGVAEAGGDGRWDIAIKEPLATGRYLLSAIAYDDRGATSLTSDSQAFTVRAKSIIAFGLVEFGWFEILVMVILLVITGGSLWSRKYILQRQKRGLYNTMVGRDIEKLSDLLAANIKELSQNLSAGTSGDAPARAYLMVKMTENVEKIKKYIKQELEKLT